jgi:hypothetical protein
LRSGDELHRGVVDDHGVKLDACVSVLLLGDTLARVEEQTISELHDVGLVDTGDLLRGMSAMQPCPQTATYLSVVLQRKVECESGDSLGLGSGGHLQALHDTRETLVLEPRVFSLGVFTDDGKVDIVVTGLKAWKGLADDDRRVDVELLTHSDVPRVVSGLVNRGEQDT